MQKKILFLLTIILGLSLSDYAFAGSGKAFVPGAWIANLSSTNQVSTKLFITNTTTHTINVTITFYDKSGNALSSAYNNYYNFINSNTQIAAKNTAILECLPAAVTPTTMGYAVITWQNATGDDDPFALVVLGNVCRYLNGGENYYTIPVNNGTPF